MAEDLLEEIQLDGADSQIQEEPSGSKPGFFGKLFAGKKKIILLGAIILVVLLLGAGGWFFFSSGGDGAEPEQVAHETLEAAKKAEEEIIFEDILALESFERIRLKGNSTLGFISLDISLELSDHRYRKQVYTVQNRIRKIIIAQVRETTWLELRSAEGKIRLKYDLLQRINSIFPKIMVRNLYFTQFLMQ